MRLKFIVPVGLLLVGGLSACGGSDAPAASVAADRPQAITAAEQATEEVVEEPLTGAVKKRAEKAALAKYPGTVLKSEIDAEQPGNYAVEIAQEAGATVEVYLDKQYNVVGTKDEAGETDND